MRKVDVQITSVICCKRFGFLLSSYDVIIFNDMSNILEYPEFVVTRKEFRFMMKIFNLGGNKLNKLENALDKGLV